MAEGRRELAGLLAAWHLAGVLGAFGAKVDPEEANPFRVERPPSRAMQELLAWRRKRSMRVFAKDMAAVARGGR